MAKKPLRAYEGNEPYIFISYAHKDSDSVLPIIRRLQDENFRVWYDAGIEAGTEWPEYIAEHIKECSCFVCFISQSALDSHNCRREINYAIKLKKNVLTAYLEDVELTVGMDMQLDILQAIFKSRHETDDSFEEELLRSARLQVCKIPPTVPEKEDGSDEKTTPEAPAEDAVESEIDAGANEVVESEPQKTDVDPEESDAESIDEIIQKAEAGDPLYQLTLAKCYDNGDMIPENHEAAEFWYKKSAEQGNEDAILVLVKKRRRTRTYDERETELLLQAAEKGNPEAQYEMGIYFAIGKNYAKAVEWFYKAAGQNHGKAQFECGECCLRGMGVPRNKDKAIEWYLKALANNGFEERLVPIMDAYLHAVRYNDPEAQYQLALYYLSCRISCSDPLYGISWLEKSAKQGFREAQNLLAIYYENSRYLGEEPPFKDEARAFHLYSEAAKQNYAPAQYNLGRCYEFGIGVEKHFGFASEMYSLAVQRGIEEAAERLNSLSLNGFTRLLRRIKKVPPLTGVNGFEVTEH